MTVKELKKALTGVPNDYEVSVCGSYDVGLAADKLEQYILLDETEYIAKDFVEEEGEAEYRELIYAD